MTRWRRLRGRRGGGGRRSRRGRTVSYPFGTAAELVGLANQHGLTIAELMARNEPASPADVRAELLRVWAVMQQCVAAGFEATGVLPGALRVRRRARLLAAELEAAPADPLHADGLGQPCALAVSEENAAGGRVVTAPTNGAAGIIPAVLHYYRRSRRGGTTKTESSVSPHGGRHRHLYKLNASISGAEVGCQGEVGVACSMAAAGLTKSWAAPHRSRWRPRSGWKHNLGLTCDPIGGLVQVPCIERCAMAAVRRSTLRGWRTGTATDEHRVSLDRVIETIWRPAGHADEVQGNVARRVGAQHGGMLSVRAVEC